MARKRAIRKSKGRKGSNRRQRLILGILFFLFAVLGASGVQHYYAPLGDDLPGFSEISRHVPRPEFSSAKWEVEIARVTRVVDGDTFIVEVAGREERIRLLHVDTPESVHPDDARNTLTGKRASDYAREQVENTQVRLESDSENRYDRFGRRLAYMFVDGKNFNVELVARGWSTYYTKYGRSTRYDREFTAAEKEAKALERGIWAKSYVAGLQQ